MTLRQDLLTALATLRGIPGPTGLDVRVTSVTIRTRTWSGGRRGLGTATDIDLVISPRPKVRKVKLSEVSASGGVWSVDDVIVDGIQPQTPGSIGYTRQQIAPEPTSDGVEIVYVLASEDSQGFKGNFRRKFAASDRPFRHTLVLEREATAPGNL